MTLTRPAAPALVAWLALLAAPVDVRVVQARADDARATAEDDALVPPPGDPWYDGSPQARRGPGRSSGLLFKDRITPHWFDDGTRFWYRNDLRGDTREFVLVDAEKGTRAPAFDHQKLADALSKADGGKTYRADKLPFDAVTFDQGAKSVRFRVGDTTWRCTLESYECSRAEPGDAPAETSQAPERPRNRFGDDDNNGDVPGDRRRSPDGKWTAFIKDHNVFLRSESESDEKKELEPVQLSTDGKAGLSYGRLSWSPDSKVVVAYRIEPGERKEVYLIQSSPPGGGRARLQTRPYALPGDKFPAYELNLFVVADRKQLKPEVDRVDFGTPRPRWAKDGRHFTYQKVDRGHQRFRLVRVDSHTGAARNVIDEKTDTFIWTAHTENLNLRTVNWLDQSGEVLYVSERDGWRHLYLIDAETGDVRHQVTKGEYVVRAIDNIDEEKHQVWFVAGGKNSGQDPYFLHHYRVNLDGSHLVALTEGDGNHSVQYSPDRSYLIDTYSRVDMAPVHELRRTSDGTLVCKLEEADTSALKASGWEAPGVFVAKGRDGKTDIWGIVSRPKDFDPGKKYPVIEQIYAGPQGSFVPKTFSPFRRSSSLTDLGFVVVQMDGMGTANRSKAFHDVCWHNLKDAGFPDRIAWHRAAGKKYPWYDLDRVGLVGTSAGGQNSTGGLLFHPEFYKVAVSSCGCHDNRMDKASWNEQWMGYPVGSWYSESSNIDNAQRLRGKLLLIVGELDTNVPPESTLRLVDALIRAGKDFDLLVVPGANHGAGGAYGQRRMNDYFVRHLLGGEPPDRNGGPTADLAVTRTGAGRGEPSTPEEARPGRAAEPLNLNDLGSDRSELRGVIERYSVDRGSLVRSSPPSPSPERDARLRDFNDGWLARLEQLEFERLGRDGQVDYLLLRNYLGHELRQLEVRSREREEAAPLYPFAKTIVDLDRSRRDVEPTDWAAVAGVLTRLRKDVLDARRKLESKPRDKEPMRRAVANRAVATVDDLRSTLQGWYRFYDGYDPLFTWWNQEPYKGADEALRNYATLLRDRLGVRSASLGDDAGGGAGRRRFARGEGTARADDPGPAPASASEREGGRDIVGRPIGREALLSELAYEMIPYSPEELIRLAETELAWCEAEMRKAARAMGRGDDWKSALEEVKSRHVEPGKQPKLIRDLAIEATDYVTSHDLVTVPALCRDSWRIGMMSPERQLVNPFFTGGETISVSFPTSSMPHEAKLMSLRGNNTHFARATVFHEVIPGHHLQGFMTARYKTYRGLFSTPFWVEGWALYWELLLWDRGFARSPEDKIGALFWRMHRCARIIFSLKFHLEQMSPQECIAFLVDRVGHERENATAEVRRSFETTYGPLYQAAYLLGGLQLRALHRELVESGKMTDRSFHDAILHENSIPIEMVRALLTDGTLSRNQAPGWRFYDLPAEEK